jgi:hypothetical protein
MATPREVREREEVSASLCADNVIPFVYKTCVRNQTEMCVRQNSVVRKREASRVNTRLSFS